MPVPTLVTDLSTTLASNSPSGSDNVFPDLDNYLRAMSGFIASIRDNSGNGWVSPYLPLTYSAGTANGVVYLNGSKVVTTGSGLVFDGTNLGLGTSTPGFKFDVLGSATESGRFRTSGAINALYLADSGTTAGSLYIGTVGNAFRIVTGSNETLRLDASGNLGLGVTPSAQGVYRTMQFGNYTTIGQQTTGTSQSFFGWNVRGSSTANQYLYNVTADKAALYEIASDASHRWSVTNTSGTAGNAITFTEAMRLDASANLGVGVVPGGSYKFQVSTLGGSAAQFISPQGNPQITASDNNVTVYVGYTSGTGASAVSYFGTSTNHAQAFLTNNVEKGRFTTAGDFLVGTTSSAAYTNGFFANATYINSGHASGTAGGTGYVLFGYDNAAIGSISQNGTTGVLYNTTSDRRLKDNIVPAPSASDDIDAIQIVSHDWKAAPDEHVKYGVIAQDLHAVAPEAVTPGDDGDEIEKTWGVDYSKLVPMLIKEIQSLRARVAALEQA
jgi:hypothetical protein